MKVLIPVQVEFPNRNLEDAFRPSASENLMAS